MPSSRNIYALLVGVDAYAPPVTPLKGCKKDVALIRDFLLRHYGEPATTTTDDGLPITRSGSLRLCVLQDERATYRNLIRGFREHLRQAGPEDVVWFHFSGHGTEHFTAAAFRESIEPNGKDQNLICFAPAGAKDELLLADKEIAVLLHEVATAKGPEPPHILVSLDCCHSGSGTRDVSVSPDVTPRTMSLHRIKVWSEAKAAGKVRDLSAYLDGYFLERGPDIPLSRHMLLSACTSVQTAGDTPAGGLFTTHLIEALKQAGGELNYADLFVRTRAALRQKGVKQLPQFATLDSFNPYTRFLDGQPLGAPDRFEVLHDGQNWLVKCGAIHGLPVNPPRPIEVEIQTSAPENRPLGTARLTAIGAQKSQLVLAGGLALIVENDYQAVLHHLPLPPLRVVLRGDEAPLDRLIGSWEADAGVAWTRAEDPDAELAVEARAGEYRILDRRSNRTVLTTSQGEKMDELIVDSLAKIVRWERTLALDNPKSAIRERVQLSVEALLAQYRRETLAEAEIELLASADVLMEKEGMWFGGFQPRVTITDTSQELYCYLLHLRADYSIQSYEGEVVFRPVEFPGRSKVTLPLLKQHKGWGLSPGEDRTTSHFQLLVTTEPLDYHQLLQDGVGASRAATWEDWQPMGISDDWCSLTQQLTLRRP